MMLRLAPWFWASLALMCLLAGTQYAHAHTVDLGAGQEHCFFEDMHSGDEMTLTYQVGGGGHLDIDVRLTDPENQLLYQHIRKDTGTYDFIAEKDGRYTYCFSNTFSTVADKSVNFNVHGVLYLTDEEGLMPVEHELRDLATNIQRFKDEQDYLVMRERLHRNTAESTNARVKWWSIGQTVLIVAVCLFQVYYVQRQFEVRRSV